jgi:hypothetical protein
MKRFVFPTALFALFIFCAASANAGKSRDKSRFHGAELLDDGRTVLFTYADSEYGYPSAPLVSFGGGRSRYIRDNKIIGLYHTERRTIDILFRFETEPGTRGRGNFLIRGTRGRMAYLVREERQREDDRLPGEMYLLNVDRGDLLPVPLFEEMSGLGMDEVRFAWLAHNDGYMVVLAYAVGQTAGQQNSVPLGHVWLRPQDGRYRLLTKHGSYLGTFGDEVLSYDHGLRIRQAYHLESGARSEPSATANTAPPGSKTHATGNPIADVAAHVGAKGKTLELRRKVDGQWEREPLPIDREQLR